MKTSPKYQVVVWDNATSKCSVLSHRNRTSWTLKTARKYLREMEAERVSGKLWAHVRAFTLVLL